MRRVLLISVALAMMGPASAADMLVKKAPSRPPVPVWSWTGFYIGGNVGGGWAKSDWLEDAALSGAGGTNPGFLDASINPASFLAGGQVGFDYQTGWAVFGVQADIDLTDDMKSTVNCFPQLAGAFTCMTNIKSMSTVTGRVGAAFDRTLLYVLGGFAWEREQLDNACPSCNGGAAVLFRSLTTFTVQLYGLRHPRSAIDDGPIGRLSAFHRRHSRPHSCGQSGVQLSLQLGPGPLIAARNK